MQSNITKIAFIGLGVMGRSMAKHLLSAGHELHTFTRTAAKAEELISLGAIWHKSVASLAQECSTVITMIGYPEDVEQAYLGEDGLIANSAEGSLLIDMTTSSPSLAKKIAEAASARSIDVIDAPVSGGDIGAQNATLSIMCGGSNAAFERAKPLFEIMGKTIVLQGAPGSGQHCKMSNQIAIASGMIGVFESLLYCRRAGLTPEVVLDSIGSGAAASWTLSNLLPRVLKEDYAPGFFIEHFVKDMKIAQAEAASMGLQLQGLDLTLKFYLALEERGDGRLGTQAIYKIIEELS